MSKDLVTHYCTKENNIVYLNAFHGGKYGRCVQLTIQNSYAQMTFKEAIDFFKTCIAQIEKLNEDYNLNPPWWESA